jgi:hypothetical protein
VNQDKIQFLQWLINRLHYKYNCSSDNAIIIKLTEIIEYLQLPINVEISDLDLDKIINQYYVDYTLDRCDDMTFGFSENERIIFRKNIRSIIKDVINKNIPKDFLIKG